MIWYLESRHPDPDSALQLSDPGKWKAYKESYYEHKNASLSPDKIFNGIIRDILTSSSAAQDHLVHRHETMKVFYSLGKWIPRPCAPISGFETVTSCCTVCTQ